MNDIDILVAGYPALANLDRHSGEDCDPCFRFAGRLWRGEDPRQNLHLRCEQAQRWQATVDAALAIVNERQR